MAFTPAEVLRDLENKFKYHPPTLEQKMKYDTLRNKFLELAKEILDATPICPDQTVAFRKLHEASIAVNSCITNNDG